MTKESKALELAKRLRNGWAKELRTEGADMIECQHAEIDSLKADVHNLNWALGTSGFEKMATPEEQAEHEAAMGRVMANVERLKSKLVRFCPECGRLGDVPEGAIDCCPDGSHAAYMPEKTAEKCAALFRDAQLAARVPDIDYEALIAAAVKRDRKWAQGTNGCIAFKCGAEWFREVALSAAPSQQAPQPAQQAAQQAPSGEPVAWRWVPSDYWREWVYSDKPDRVSDAMAFLGEDAVQALYLHPQQASEPMTPEQIKASFERRMLAFGWRNFEGCMQGEPLCWYYDEPNLNARWIGWRALRRASPPNQGEAMSLTDEQIISLYETTQSPKGPQWTSHLEGLRAIESAATAPLLGRIAELERELEALHKDANRLDFLDSMGNGMKWIARNSNTGRGWRLHNDRDGQHETVRAAIDAAKEQG